MKNKSLFQTEAESHLSSPRVQFNFGFHDATFDKERGNNRLELIEWNGKVYPLPQGEQHKYYRLGYAYGQDEDISNGRPESSEMAWRKFNVGNSQL